MRTEAFERAVEVTRGGNVESVHAAAIAVCDPEGRLLRSLGDPDVGVILRSAAKPFQAAAVLASGAAESFGLTESEIALIAGSHAGEEVHRATAASILSKAGLGVATLQCGVHTPFSKEAALALAREGRHPDPLMNNCSGKHAGMLAAAQAGGHPVETYLEPGHPVQQAILESLARFTGRRTTEIGLAVDGCSAPTFALSLRELATAFARLVSAHGGNGGQASLESCLERVARAMQARPDMVAGAGMLDTSLMRATPGLVAKIGAEGIHGMGWSSPSGPIGMALKVMDGDDGRARTAVVIRLLTILGAFRDDQSLPESLRRHRLVLNHRRLEVGEVRAIFSLREGG